MSRLYLAVIAGLTAVSCFFAVPAWAVPDVDHVLIECDALRLNVNNSSIRHQIKVLVTLSSTDEAKLAEAQRALMTITRPDGTSKTIGSYSRTNSPKQFKTAIARILFKVVSDSADPEASNVQVDFFDSMGPYRLELSLGNEAYLGEVTFGEPLTMELRQEGKPCVNFVLRDEAGLDLYTAPATFGPVYYKQQDMANFVFQLANMEISLETCDYHAPVESPRYLFQVRISDGQGGPARLVDPSRYIDGYKSHMIRSDKTSTPLYFMAEEFESGEAVVVDFKREDTMPPDTVFTSTTGGVSSNVTLTERVLYVLSVEPRPSAKELGLVETEN